jgi:ABC-type branched-subunit amino acid transport system substrate-binding protein
VRRVVALLAAAGLLAGCGGGTHTTKSLLVVVNAPFSKTPYLGRTIENGVRLASSEANAAGVHVGRQAYQLRVEVLDNALSPARAVANVRHAAAEHAVAIVDEGTGVDASWRAAHGIPICIVFQGGKGLVDPATRRNVFRIAPTDHGVAFRLAEYLIPKRYEIALLHDDTDYGVQGEQSLREAFSANRSSVAIDETLPADALDLGPQLLRARRAHATAVLVWGRAATIAAALSAARSAGWRVPFFAPPSAEDPFLRQQVADHPSWLEGLTFAGGRLTAEVGTGPFEAFEQKYESAYGVDRVGVRTREGQQVVAPPETGMYAYDFVNLLVAALAHAKSTQPADVTSALEQVSIEGANGDQRGFNEASHEGVVDDDVYFARFSDMTFRPVKDDALSATLPTLPQTR